MNINEITKYVMGLSLEEVRRLSATDVMGWRLVDIHERTDGCYCVPCMAWMDADGIAGHLVSYWRPDEDRNQSRMVTDKVESLKPGFLWQLSFKLPEAMCQGWYRITPDHETRAALIAHMIHKQDIRDSENDAHEMDLHLENIGHFEQEVGE